MSLIAGLKMEGTVKWRGLKSQGPLYYITANLSGVTGERPLTFPESEHTQQYTLSKVYNDLPSRPDNT